jgi:aminoglycoside 3-N-acetyltransferase
MHSRARLARDFTRLGVEPGDLIMLHASVRAVGEVAGGPDQIHLALKVALTPEGTLLMYAGCPRYYDEVGRGMLTPPEEQEIVEHLPPFDALTARAARDHGVLVEMLRTYPGTRVNDHVARFAGWGRHVDHLFSVQPWNHAFGAGSALERFVERGGKILLLGSDHDAVTILHYAEHVGDFPGKRVARYKVPLEEGGRRVWRDQEEFDTSGDGVHPHWPDRFFARITDTYLAAAGNHGGPVGNAHAYLFPARELIDFALGVMVAVAADAGAADRLLHPA